ncbi:MAG: aldo/keto reductase [Caldilineaceae bacterium]|jgi:aryl-alcohol dehydrogenase-like predicted oxidoreductase
MQYRNLGRTGLKVSAFCLGTMQWDWTADEATSFQIMDAFVDAGGNFLDTADIYSKWLDGHVGGESEEVIGRWIAARKNRNDVVIATKVRGAMGDGPNDEGLSRRHILDAAEASLRRLQTDYIDLYQTHWFDAATPIDETMSALDTLVRQGKVRYVGCSNYPAWRLVQSLWASDRHQLVRYDSIQPHYNLVHRREFEQDLAEIVTEYNIGVIPYSPLAGGFLTGKYDRENVPNSARAQGVRQRYFNEAGWRTLDAVRLVAKQTDSSPAVVSLAWLLAQSFMTAPIIGANNVEQLQQSLDAVDLQLTPEQKDMLSEASAWRRDEG